MESSTLDHGHHRQRDVGYWVPLGLLAFVLFGGLLVGAYSLGQTSGSSSHADIETAVATRTATDRKAAAAEMVRARKRFDRRLGAATTKAREQGYAAGRADASGSAVPISDQDAGAGGASSDPCAAEGVC